MSKKYIKKCKECGSDTFNINEFIVYRASLNKDDGELSAYKTRNNGVEMIICAKCSEEYYINDFKNVNFFEG